MKIGEIVEAMSFAAAPPGPAAGGIANPTSSDSPFSPLGADVELPPGELENRKNMRDRDKSLFTKNTINIDDHNVPKKAKKKGKLKHIYNPQQGMY